MNIFKEWQLKQELKKYHMGQQKLAERRERMNYMFISIGIGIILLIIIYVLGYRYKVVNLSSIMIFLLVCAVIILWISNYNLRKDITLYQRGEGNRDAKIMRSLEDKNLEKRNQLTHIILKNEEGYDIKTWNVGKASSLLIGKNSRIRVDIDLSTTSYASLISKNHAILNKTDKGWFLEDLGSVNGTGIQKGADNRKMKVRNTPVKVESGDIIYIATTALLIK